MQENPPVNSRIDQAQSALSTAGAKPPVVTSAKRADNHGVEPRTHLRIGVNAIRRLRRGSPRPFGGNMNGSHRENSQD
jgi:hypothetical protein